MSQNISTAVMQRRVEPDDSLDDFPTPRWATRAAIEHVLIPVWDRIARPRLDFRNLIACDPAANRGYMVRSMAEYFGHVMGSDVYDYGVNFPVRDFLFPGQLPAAHVMLTNPPFRLAVEFIERSFEIPHCDITGVIVRTSFLEGSERYDRLFKKNPPTVVAQHVERVIMTKGIVRDPAKEYWDEVAQKMRRPSTATSYCWLFWIRHVPPMPTMWIPPCRKQLERPGDYPE